MLPWVGRIDNKRSPGTCKRVDICISEMLSAGSRCTTLSEVLVLSYLTGKLARLSKSVIRQSLSTLEG